MTRLIGAALALTLGSSASLGLQDKKAKAESQVPKPIKLALTPAKYKKGALRMGYGLQQEVPVEGWQAKGKDPTESFHFFDLNTDGKLESSTDGFGIVGIPFVVPLPDKLLTKSGQFRIELEGTRELVLIPEDLGSTQSFVAEVSAISDLRVRAGVKPVPIDLMLSRACEKHLDYLSLNGLADGKTGDPHAEDPGKPGYSDEGAAAGKDSCLSFGNKPISDAIAGYYASAWHGPPMLDPRLEAVGIAKKHGAIALHVGRIQGDLNKPFVHPADGAAGIPRSFASAGELPNPVPGTKNGKGCGYPIIAMLAAPLKELTSAEVIDGKGNVIKGTLSSPARPANPSEWPSNSDCAVFIPAQPLSPNMLYRATFRFAEEKMPLQWSFTTGQ